MVPKGPGWHGHTRVGRKFGSTFRCCQCRSHARLQWAQRWLQRRQPRGGVMWKVVCNAVAGGGGWWFSGGWRRREVSLIGRRGLRGCTYWTHHCTPRGRHRRCRGRCGCICPPAWPPSQSTCLHRGCVHARAGEAKQTHGWPRVSDKGRSATSTTGHRHAAWPRRVSAERGCMNRRGFPGWVAIRSVHHTGA